MTGALDSIGALAVTQGTAPHLGGKLQGNGNIDKTAKEFESMFMSQMLQPMFDGMQVDPLFGGGQGEKIMRSFLVQEYGKLVTDAGGFGIADAVKREMIKAQGVK